ncbi:MAG TPA: S-adenosylmethionine:tRNA ribosyltransferase-isomerase [Chitinophagaceae bacterium]|nr:S-adenosylmethionine:tRNA ribosyltransferase-isomerase [Chitinophagaceae bacterium]
MHPRHLSIKDYTYALPENRIAKFPLAERDASRLLIYNKGRITEDIFKNIADHIPQNSLLFCNDTKVMEARLLFRKPTGGMIEIFCLEPHEQYANISIAFQQQENVLWQCFIGGASKWKHGQLLEKKIKIAGQEILLCASYKEKRSDSFIIGFSWAPAHLTFADVLHYMGAIPLPPYIKREVDKSDAERYQTVYAHFEGSVAAPTAGLHFTEKVFKKLKQKEIKSVFVTLHVGAATFKPVKSKTMNEHEMHAEFIEVKKNTIENILHHLNNKIIAVGTTSFRTLESLYWLGSKTNLDPSIEPSSLSLSQWEAYEQANNSLSPAKALKSLLDWMNANKVKRLRTKTRIIIAPGYKTKIVQALVTNFHQPQSTLLLLIAAFIGDDWKKVYAHALGNDFRFLSYGDGSLLWVKQDFPQV